MIFLDNAIDSLKHILVLNPQYGIIATFVIAFVESLAIIGSIVPGSITMSIIGSMIGASILPLVPTLSIAIIGSYLGDILSFWFGKKCQPKIAKLNWFKKNHSLILKAELFIQKYGVASIVIGRFFGPMRSMVPMLAGALKMNNIKFLFAAIPSAVLWSIVYLTPGIILGIFSNNLDIISKKNILLFLIILGFFSTYFYYSGEIKNYLLNKRDCLYNKYFPQKNHTQLNLRFISLILLAIFILVSIKLPQLNSKYPLYYFAQSLQQTQINYIMTFITLIADKYTFIIFVCLVSIASSKKEARFLILSSIICIALTYVLKKLFFIHRPPKIASWNSFPSGHSIRASFIFNYIGLRFFLKNKNIYKVMAIVPLIIAASRLYIGAHWWPDVIAGLSIGSFIIIFTYSFFMDQNTNLKYKNLIITLIIAGYLGVIIHKIENDYMEFFFGEKQSINVTFEQWMNKPNILPAYLKNRMNRPYEALNVQWLSSIQQAKTNLAKNGWHTNKWPNTWIDRINKAISSPEIRLLPALPKLHNNKKPVIIASKKENNTMNHMILWESGLKVKNKPVLIGNVVKYKIFKNNVYKQIKYINLKLSGSNSKVKILVNPPYKIFFNPNIKVTKVF